MRSLFLAALSFAAFAPRALAAGAPEGSAAPAPYSGKTSALELPDISVIVNAQLDFTDPDDPDRNQKLRIKEAELAVQGYLYPSIRGDFIAALEQEYMDNEVETEVDLEEAYVTFLEIPGGFQALAGRKLLNFGRLNPIHPHHWHFAETPLPLLNLFGDHPWFDDGAELSSLIPNPGNLYLKLSGGIWNGRSLAHSHGHGEDEHGEAHGEEEQDEEHHAHGLGEELVEWDGLVYFGRAFADVPVTDAGALQLGYSLSGDEGNRNLLQGVDLVLKHQAPGTRRKITWHTEVLFARDKERDTSPFGLFTYLTFAPDTTWELGGGYDFTEFLADDTRDAWAANAYLTRYLTHTTYLRAGYRYTEYSDEELEQQHLAYLQLVWGLGPHAHRLED